MNEHKRCLAAIQIPSTINNIATCGRRSVRDIALFYPEPEGMQSVRTWYGAIVTSTIVRDPI